MIDIELRRRLFAEEITAVANLRTRALSDALAVVPREDFLPPGPWLVQSEASGPRQTPDADPAHVYHDYSVTIDPARQLFNGTPTFVTGLIDALRLQPGSAVLHVGAGLGYYTALLGHTVGASGHVRGIEVDPDLAARAAQNLRARAWVRIECGNATTPLDRRFDAILVNAGVTHPLDVWLDALEEGGRLMLPLTAAIPAMGPLSKGGVVMLTKAAAGAFDARVLTFTVIYTGIGLRDDTLNEPLGRAFMRMPFPRLKRLRRDAHEPAPECWLHGERFCFSMN